MSILKTYSDIRSFATKLGESGLELPINMKIEILLNTKDFNELRRDAMGPDVYIEWKAGDPNDLCIMFAECMCLFKITPIVTIGRCDVCGKQNTFDHICP